VLFLVKSFANRFSAEINGQYNVALEDAFQGAVTFPAQAPRVEHGAAAGAGEEAAFAPAAEPVPAPVPVPVDAQQAAAAAVVRAQIVWIQLSVLIKLAVICFLCTANREMSTMRLTIIIGNGFIFAFF
jgi:hypothetical protein